MLRDLLLPILLAIPLQGISLAAVAAPGDTFSPFVSATMTHDSNLLRLANAAGAGTDDTIRQMAAGMNVDWKIARQHVLLTAVVNDNRFNRYSTLNYQGRDLQASWNWQLGNHVSGDLGYTNNLTMGSFADQRGLVRNQRTQQRQFFDGRWLFHPSWQVGIGASTGRLTYADAALSASNREDDALETTLHYLSSTSSKIGIKLRTTNGNYPNQPINYAGMVDNGYRQSEALATADWNFSGHSLLHGQAGAVQRKHDHFSSRDYNEFNARASYAWLPTAKVRLDASAWREVWAYDDLTSSYSLNRGLSLEPSWAPTSKITVSGRVQREKRDFLGNPGVLVLSASRVDTYDARKLTVSYRPTRNCHLNASLGDEKRNSNQSQYNFNSEMISINAIFQM